MSDLYRKCRKEFGQAYRYFIASLVALGCDMGVLHLLTNSLQVPYLIANAASFTLGLIVVYLISIYWVFPRTANKNRAREFVIFSLIGIAGLGINEAMIWLCHGILFLDLMISKGLAAVIGFLWNFILRKTILFSKGMQDG